MVRMPHPAFAEVSSMLHAIMEREGLTVERLAEITGDHEYNIRNRLEGQSATPETFFRQLREEGHITLAEEVELLLTARDLPRGLSHDVRANLGSRICEIVYALREDMLISPQFREELKSDLDTLCEKIRQHRRNQL